LALAKTAGRAPIMGGRIFNPKKLG